MSAPVRSIRSSVLTTQARRSLRAWDRAKALCAADQAVGLAPAGPFDRLSPHERAPYLAQAEGELASAVPQFPRRDETVGRDQVHREHRAAVLGFGGSRV